VRIHPSHGFHFFWGIYNGRSAAGNEKRAGQRDYLQGDFLTLIKKDNTDVSFEKRVVPGKLFHRASFFHNLPGWH
jgi:hypothetical protein